MADRAAATHKRVSQLRRPLQSKKSHPVIDDCLKWMRATHTSRDLCDGCSAQERFGCRAALVSVTQTSTWLPHTFSRKYNDQAGAAMALHGHGAVVELLREGDACWRRGCIGGALAAWRTALRASMFGTRGRVFSTPKILSARATCWQHMRTPYLCVACIPHMPRAYMLCAQRDKGRAPRADRESAARGAAGQTARHGPGARHA